MVSNVLAPIDEQCNAKTLTYEEFLNKLRSLTELNLYDTFPENPEEFYRIKVNNTYKCVDIKTSYAIIDIKLENYIRSNWVQHGLTSDQDNLNRKNYVC